MIFPGSLRLFLGQLCVLLGPFSFLSSEHCRFFGCGLSCFRLEPTLSSLQGIFFGLGCSCAGGFRLLGDLCQLFHGVVQLLVDIVHLLAEFGETGHEEVSQDSQDGDT